MKNIQLSAPQSWNELTTRQLLYVCRLFMLKYREYEFKLFVFLKFTGARALPEKIIAGHVYWFFKLKKQRFSLSIDELNSFLASFDYLLADSKLTTNRFPSLRILLKRYWGPENKMYNVTFLEFLSVEATIQKYHTSKNPLYLRQLAAILYRKQVKPYNPASPDYQGDRREKFNDYTFQKRAKRFGFLDTRKLYAIYIFYIGCRNHIMEKHPNLFESKTTDAAAPADVVKNLRSIVFALNGGDITLNTEIYNTKVWEVFGQLENTIVEHKKNVK
jgi:hypothetical protein